MIKVTVKYVDGVEFIDKMEIVKPDYYRYGVPIYRIFRGDLTPQIKEAVKLLGLKYINYDEWETSSYLYTLSRAGKYWYHIAKYCLRIYWTAIRWSYNNLRLFQEIPRDECFNWKYLTPYVWIQNIVKWIRRMK